ncbi:bacillithiol biosynthesis cysteine-adding enzyme BshC [bacterium]|nr:bacillithiol biosynthesis cysteine-adding enzyme BshC [bacterium]
MLEAINWGSLPDIPHVMTEFIAGRQSVIDLLGGNWRDEKVRTAALERRARFNRPAGLGNAIRKGYGDIDIPAEVELNLEKLNYSDAVAIVTGQQVGICGGPLYTFYKALTAILFARQLQKQVSVPVIPIFWMETADSDFSQVNQIGFPAEPDDSRLLFYTSKEIITGRSVNFHRITGEIEEICSTVSKWLEKLPHTNKIIGLVEQSYRTDRPISDAFRELMTGLLGDMGLVMINPLDPAITARTTEFWNKCLDKPEKLNKSFKIASRELSDLQFPLQVNLRDEALPILHIDDQGMRRRIIGQPGAWKIKELNEKLSDSDLQKLAKTNPESLSPSVLLRPVLQDWLLPTWIYVAGPAEVAYHAQIGRCYDLLNIPRPLIAPRLSATIVENSVRRLLDKNNWTVMDVLGGREILLRSSGRVAALAELFDNGAEQLGGWFERIERSIEDVGVNCSPEIDRSVKKMLYQWNKLRQITLNKIAERDRVRLNHANRLVSRIVPDGMLQERYDNVLYYLAAYGNQLIESLSEYTDIFDPRHLAIHMEAT